MGLIMLILIETVPTTYALNHAVTYGETQTFIAVSHETAGHSISNHSSGCGSDRQ